MKRIIIISIISCLSCFTFGQNVLLDNDFDTDVIGTGWTSLTQTGNTDYQVGTDDAIGGNEGSYVYFDDSDNPAAPPSRVQLVSPDFDGFNDQRIELELQVNFKNRIANMIPMPTSPQP